jgi:hypothetical protein
MLYGMLNMGDSVWYTEICRVIGYVQYFVVRVFNDRIRYPIPICRLRRMLCALPIIVIVDVLKMGIRGRSLMKT